MTVLAAKLNICTWTRLAIVLAALWWVLLPAGGNAAEIVGESTTIPYIYSEDIQQERREYLALYEFLDFGATDVGVANLSFGLAGWGRGDLLDKIDPDETAVGDAQLNAAFVSWHDPDYLLNCSLGRRLVVIGPVAEPLDGAIARVEPIPGIGVEAFGGVPVVSEVGERDGDFGYGARVFGGWSPYFEIGFSPAAFTEKGDPDRQIFGGDVSITPLRWFDVFGHAYYDNLYSSWYDLGGTLVVRPVTDLKLLGQFERLMPSAYLGMGSIFSVFSFATIDKTNAEARYVVARRVTLAADYNHYLYDQSAPADRYGGAVGVLWGERRDNTANAGVYNLTGDDRGYLETRGYVYQRLGKLFYAALDAIHYQLRESIYGVDQGFYGTGSLGWNVVEDLAVQASGIYVSSPYYDQDVRGLLKVAYRFGTGSPYLPGD